MKKVRVYNNIVDVIVQISWDNILYDDVKELDLKAGDDLGIFYRNKKSEYKFENLVVYDRPYHPQEKLDFLLAKNPTLQKLIDQYNFVLSL
jgi:hypothetical protein